MIIGIVTQPLWGNYGGILQNYALQQVLKRLGHEPVTLDFMIGATGINYIYRLTRKIGAYLMGRSKSWRLPYALGRSVPAIDEFVDKYIDKTPPFWNRYDDRLISRYSLDALIVGSDQVWRPRYNSRLTDMYLGFCKDSTLTKISYAASFGTSKNEYSKSLAMKCGRLLHDFNAISVRESSGINLIKDLFGQHAVQVLDPTLLAGKEVFDDLCSDISHSKSTKSYLGSYILDSNPEITLQVKDLCNNYCNGESIVMAENTPNLNPKSWISIIKGSKIFVTDSFHGTIFCILYHVPFVTLVNKKRGADRFTSLLEPLGLQSQLIDNVSSLASANFNICWNSVDIILAEQREKSLQFLRNAIE